MRKKLTVPHYLELMDSRIILGINSLFYVTNALLLYISFCHIVLVHLEDVVVRAANLAIVLNSTFKLLVYVALSHDFRHWVNVLFRGHGYLDLTPTAVTEDAEKRRRFVEHARVVTFVAAKGQLCENVDEN